MIPLATNHADGTVLDLLRDTGPMGVSDLATAMGVTATAVRMRLTRLMGQGWINRETAGRGRGRPSHQYSLTKEGRRQLGNNFADLAIVLWNEMRAVSDPSVRQGLISRVAEALAARYQDQITGRTAEEKLRSVAALMTERHVSASVVTTDSQGQLPVLSLKDCPYPELAEQDRGICSMEKMLLSRLLDEDVTLSQCRLDGDACCQFQTT